MPYGSCHQQGCHFSIYCLPSIRMLLWRHMPFMHEQTAPLMQANIHLSENLSVDTLARTSSLHILSFHVMLRIFQKHCISKASKVPSFHRAVNSQCSPALRGGFHLNILCLSLQHLSFFHFPSQSLQTNNVSNLQLWCFLFPHHRW